MTRIIETKEERLLRLADEVRWEREEKNRRLSVILVWVFYSIFIVGVFWAFSAFAEKTTGTGICFAVLIGAGVYVAMLIGAKIRGEE